MISGNIDLITHQVLIGQIKQWGPVQNTQHAKKHEESPLLLLFLSYPQYMETGSFLIIFAIYRDRILSYHICNIWIQDPFLPYPQYMETGSFLSLSTLYGWRLGHFLLYPHYLKTGSFLTLIISNTIFSPSLLFDLPSNFN